jgi:hypothetical protein
LYPVTAKQENNEAPDPEELPLVPLGRDWPFLLRLVLGLVLAVLAAVFVASKLPGAAARAGSNLLRPGASVIPPTHPSLRDGG